MAGGVEAAVIGWLNSLGLPAAACGDRPEKCAGPVVTVERTGGPAQPELGVERPQVAVRAWGGTRAEALGLARDIAAALPGLEGTGGVCSAQVNSIAHMPVDGIETYQVLLDLVSYI